MRRRLGLAGCLVFAVSNVAASQTTIILVRHAEKVDDSRDPELTEEGRLRARRLAVMLADAGIEAIYSTDLIRTRETARPLADTLGAAIRIYEGGKLGELAALLGTSGERALVVGHSNTTAELVRLLGGDPGDPIADDEYDRLYVVHRPREGGAAAVVTLLRY